MTAMKKRQRYSPHGNLVVVKEIRGSDRESVGPGRLTLPLAMHGRDPEFGRLLVVAMDYWTRWDALDIVQ